MAGDAFCFSNTKARSFNIKVTAGDFQHLQLYGSYISERNKQVVDAWEQYGEHRQTVGFTVDINHAKDLAKIFQDRGHRFEAVWVNAPTVLKSWPSTRPKK